MTQQLRIAVLTAPGSSLREHLQALTATPLVQEFADLYGDAAAIKAFAPRLLFLEPGRDFVQDLGALRLLCAFLPGLGTALVCEAELAPRLRSSCEEHGLSILTQPLTPDRLQAFVDRILGGGSQIDSESYLQFVQGICDEINNPLMFASGHLQLLQSRIDPEADRAAVAQLAAVRQGLGRISETMRKVGAMSRATRMDRQHETFAIATLLARTEERLREAGLSLAIDCSDAERVLPLEGDLDLLAGALFSLCQVGCELAPDGDRPGLGVSRSKDTVELRLVVDHSRLNDWELPQAFAPYHLNKILRGTNLGLDLFLVRLVARAHGGDAMARRLTGRGVEFCVTLGAAGAS